METIFCFECENEMSILEEICTVCGVFISEKIRFNKDNPTVLLDKGIKAQLNKDFDEALDCFNTILIRNPKSVEALHNKAITLEFQGKLEEAVKVYDKALNINPNDVNIRFNRGIVLKTLEQSANTWKCKKYP